MPTCLAAVVICVAIVLAPVLGPFCRAVLVLALPYDQQASIPLQESLSTEAGLSRSRQTLVKRIGAEIRDGQGPAL